MNETITRWFGRLHRVGGVIAYGLRTPEQQTFSRTWEAPFPEEALNEFWLKLNTIADVAVPSGEVAESLSWSFREHVVTGVARPDGLTFFVLRTKDARTSDEAGLTRLANEFRGLRAS